VQGKGAKQRFGAVWVYITSKCLVWWGRAFWDWISISVSVKLGAVRC